MLSDTPVVPADGDDEYEGDTGTTDEESDIDAMLPGKRGPAPLPTPAPPPRRRPGTKGKAKGKGKRKGKGSRKAKGEALASPATPPPRRGGESRRVQAEGKRGEGKRGELELEAQTPPGTAPIQKLDRARRRFQRRRAARQRAHWPRPQPQLALPGEPEVGKAVAAAAAQLRCEIHKIAREVEADELEEQAAALAAAGRADEAHDAPTSVDVERAFDFFRIGDAGGLANRIPYEDFADALIELGVADELG